MAQLYLSKAFAITACSPCGRDCCSRNFLVHFTFSQAASLRCDTKQMSAIKWVLRTRNSEFTLVHFYTIIDFTFPQLSSFVNDTNRLGACRFKLSARYNLLLWLRLRSLRDCSALRGGLGRCKKKRPKENSRHKGLILFSSLSSTLVASIFCIISFPFPLPSVTSRCICLPQLVTIYCCWKNYTYLSPIYIYKIGISR